MHNFFGILLEDSDEEAERSKDGKEVFVISGSEETNDKKYKYKFKYKNW